MDILDRAGKRFHKAQCELEGMVDARRRKLAAVRFWTRAAINMETIHANTYQGQGPPL